MTDNQTLEPGGFIPLGGLPSPAPSTSSTRSNAGLPHPRAKALRPGSNKEDYVRRFVEERLLHMSRRYVKKFGNPEPGDSVVGYKSFGEVCKDMDSVINVLWRSGTPALQIPFLLRLGSDFTQYVRSFPAAPKASFAILRKLDHSFASLLSGQDIATQETLPGFENGLREGMTTTDMVRCRSLVEQTRVSMVEILSGPDQDDEDDDDEDEEMDDTQASESEREAQGGSNDVYGIEDEEEEKLHLDAARVYENTIVQLNERLGDPLDDRTATTC